MQWNLNGIFYSIEFDVAFFFLYLQFKGILWNFFRPNEIIMLFYSIICLFYLILFYSTYHYISKQIIHALLLKMLSYKTNMV